MMMQKANHEGRSTITITTTTITSTTADTATPVDNICCELCCNSLPKKAFVRMTSLCTHEPRHCLFCVVIFVEKLLERYKLPPSLRYSSRRRIFYPQNSICINGDSDASSKQASQAGLSPGPSSSLTFASSSNSSSSQFPKICCMHGSCDEVLTAADIALFSSHLSALPDVIKEQDLCPICAENRSKRYDFRPLPMRCHRRLQGLNNCIPGGRIMSNVCIHCISMHISTQVRTSRNSAVPCLCMSSSTSLIQRNSQFRCTYVYSRDDVAAMRLPDKNVLHELGNLLSQEAIERMPGFTWCPFQGCGSGQVHDSTNGNGMTYEACKRVSCVRHHMPWHEGRSCEEYEQHVQRIVERDHGGTCSAESNDGSASRSRLLLILRRGGTDAPHLHP